MFNRYLIIPLTAVLLASCATLYTPTPDIVGENPATLRIEKISAESNVSDTSVAIHRYEVICKIPGEVNATITRLGLVEKVTIGKNKRGNPIKDFPESTQIPSKQKIIVEAGFSKDYFLQQQVCNLAFSFVPEPGAVYLLQRDFKTTFFTPGECRMSIAKVVAPANGETLQKMDYRWGSMYAFLGEKFICDEHGNYKLKPPQEPKKKVEKQTKQKKGTKKTEEDENSSGAGETEGKSSTGQ